MGVFCKKKWTFPPCRGHYVQYQYFFILHCAYLGVRTHPTHPPPAYGPGLIEHEQKHSKVEGVL